MPANAAAPLFDLIREEQPADIRGIRRVNNLAFGQHAEGEIVDRLRASGCDCLSLVAVRDDGIVGHILFSPAYIEAGGRGERVWGMGLAPMAVLPDWQGRGIGSALIETGISCLRERGCPFVIVLGHPDYYPRFGFEPASRHSIRCQWEVPDEGFMVLLLKPATINDATGTAYYREEFESTDDT